MSTRLALLALVAFAVTLTGCGNSGEPCFPVTGTVKFEDGTPLTKGIIYFDSGEFSAKGGVEEDGRFTLTSYNPGDGAPDGQYSVYFSGDARTQNLVAKEFCDEEGTPLSYQVEKKSNVFDIQVTKPK
jgi:hypothetical protein